MAHLFFLAEVPPGTSTSASRTISVPANPLGSRIFIAIQNAGGNITSMTLQGKVLADFTKHVDFQIAPAGASAHRVQIFSILLPAAITAAINLVVGQATSAVMAVTVLTGFFDVVAAATAYAESVTGVVGPQTVTIDLPDTAGDASVECCHLIAGTGIPSGSASGASTWASDTNAQLLTEQPRSNNRHAVFALYRAPGVSIGTGKHVTYAYTNTGTNINGAGIGILKLVPMNLAVANGFTPKVQVYSGHLRKDDAVGIPKSQSYVDPRKGIAVGKVMLFSANSVSTDDQQQVAKMVVYAPRLRVEVPQGAEKITMYALTGMLITGESQFVRKGVVYAATLFDSTRSLLQVDPANGPNPALWKLDKTYPYVQLNDGSFRFFIIDGGTYTIFLYSVDGDLLQQQVELDPLATVDIPFMQDFNQIAFIRAPYNTVLGQSVKKRMELNRVLSSSF